MKVKLLRTPSAAYGCELAEGETGEVNDALGRRLVDSDLAVCLDPPKPLKAVPEEPKVAEATATEKKATKSPAKGK